MSSRPLVCILDDVDGVADGLPALERLREVAEVQVLGEADEEQVVAAAREAMVIIPIRERRAISAGLLDQLPRLEHIAQTGGGAAHVDEEALVERDIGLSLTPGASAPAVAELVLALIMAAERGILSGANALRDGRWERGLGRELSSLTIGVLGAGATGQAVLERASALGAQVRVASRRPAAGAQLSAPQVGEKELFSSSDVVSIHVELSHATRGLVDRDALTALGPAGGLVNTARADIVDQTALLEVLQGGQLGWAAVDVFATEPPVGDPLVGHERVLATPHLGWRTHETLSRYLERAIDNAVDYLTRRNNPSER